MLLDRIFSPTPLFEFDRTYKREIKNQSVLKFSLTGFCSVSFSGSSAYASLEFMPVIDISIRNDCVNFYVNIA